MGICKCPQRKVTILFCCSHRVNVCPDCVVENHPKCIIDTYHNWLYSPALGWNCQLCDSDLQEGGETVRLLCFHLVHWDCLDKWARALPATTAPAGYKCPVCKEFDVFPAPNLVSPLVPGLTSLLKTANWGRAGLGLPPLEEKSFTPISNGDDIMIPKKNEFETGSGIKNAHVNSTVSMPMNDFNHHDHQHHYVEPNFNNNPVFVPRKSARTEFEIEPLLNEDEELKYHRRSSTADTFRRCFNGSGYLKNKRSRRRLLIGLGIFGLIILIFIVMSSSSSGSNSSDDDDFLANPNVMIGDGNGIAQQRS